MKTLKRYKLLVLFTGISILTAIVWPTIRLALINNTLNSFAQMIGVLPPIFLLLGLLDQWVPRDIVIRYMGKRSGLLGVILSIVLGASSAGPLYGAFPFAAIMLNKGVRLGNVVIFLSAWATLKIPMFLFELNALGPRFALFRWLLNVPAILLIAYIIEKATSQSELDQMLERIKLTANNSI